MAIDQLNQFMNAIGTIESSNRYDAIGPNTGSTYGRARGRYQIMETIWDGWAREAGVPGADWRDPQMQDRVASHKMSQYYKKYGSWDLVAVAWFAGPGRADRAAKQGIQSLSGITDVLGTDVATYARKAIEAMGQVSNEPPSRQTGRMIEGTEADPVSTRPTEQQVARRQSAQQARAATDMNAPEQDQQVGSHRVMSQILASMRTAAQQQGGQVLDLKAMTGAKSANREVA